MSYDVGLKRFNIILRDMWQAAVESPALGRSNLDRVFPHERYQRDVNNEHTMIPYSVPNWHHHHVGDVDVIRSP